MRYFVISDIHSFYDEMIEALDEKGFDKEKDTLIVCGDIFDRGTKPLEVYKYLKSLPHKILIRGNHEYLLRDLYNRGTPYEHDYSNGTYDTLAYLNGEVSDRDFRTIEVYDKSLHDETLEDFNKVWDNYRINLQKRNIRLFASKKTKEILDWIFSDEWVNYYELEDYIFVHAFIPVKSDSELPMYYTRNRKFEYREDWRNATPYEWEDATWGCPWKLFKDGLNQTGKTIVCGHWHTSDFFNELDGKSLPRTECPLYISKGLIGLDGCTALTKQVNVLIVEV